MADMFKAIEVYLERQRKDLVAEGRVALNTAGQVRVRLKGSDEAQPAIAPRNEELEVGDYVVCLRPSRQDRWIIVGTISRPGSKKVTGGPGTEYQIHPPGNIRTEDFVPGRALLIWDAPIQQPVAFDVQISVDQSSANAQRVLTTRGSYAIIDVSSDAYVRVRSISSDGRFSAWSAWYYVRNSQITNPDVAGYVDYSFTSDTPYADTIKTFGGGSLIRSIAVVISTPFVGNFDIAVGQQGNLERFLAYGDTVPSVAGIYKVDPLIELEEETSLDFYPSSTGALGAGRIIISF